MEKLTKTTIKIFILYVTVSLMFGCVSKKKLKESQDLQSTYILDQTEKKWTNSVQNIKSELSESILSQFNETIKSFKESSSTNENETTDVTVNITAEDGKEKSATVGNTTVTSNGADISVKTSSTKATDKKLETLNSELTQSLNKEINARISLENQFSEYVKEQNKINESLKAQLEKSSKETDKKGLIFWVGLIMIVGGVLFIAIKYFKVKIPFV